MQPISELKISNEKYMDKWSNILTSVWPFTKLFGQFILFMDIVYKKID